MNNAPIPLPNPKSCGIGKGAECCVFLTCGARGFECEKDGELHELLATKEMNAKRKPTEAYPLCQIGEQ